MLQLKWNNLSLLSKILPNLLFKMNRNSIFLFGPILNLWDFYCCDEINRLFSALINFQVMNPGPPVTLDYMPIPYKPYKTVYNELQTKFNKYLAISATLLIVSLTLVRLELKVPLSG